MRSPASSRSTLRIDCSRSSSRSRSALASASSCAASRSRFLASATALSSSSERPGPDGSSGAAAALPAGDLEAELLELPGPRGDVLRVLAQLPLHLLDLRERLLVAAPHVQSVGHSGKCVFEIGWWQPPTGSGTARAMMRDVADPELQAVTDGVVTLRPPHPGDAQLLVEGRDGEFFRWLGPGADSPSPVACVWVGAELIGWIDYDLEHDWLRPGEVNLGYYLFPAARGKGYLARAVELLLLYLGRETEHDVATLVIDPENARSLALARRLGFLQKGKLEGDCSSLETSDRCYEARHAGLRRGRGCVQPHTRS